MTNVILGLGYLLAVPPLFIIIRALRRSNESWATLTLASEWAGAAFITGGWIAKGNTPAWIINLSWLVIFTGLWVRASLKKRRPQ